MYIRELGRAPRQVVKRNNSVAVTLTLMTAVGNDDCPSTLEARTWRPALFIDL